MFRACIFFTFFLFCSFFLSAQSYNNGNSEPIQICLSNLNTCAEGMTEAVAISSLSDLQNEEFIIIDQAIMATNGSGSAIIGIEVDEIVKPSELGGEFFSRYKFMSIKNG